MSYRKEFWSMPTTQFSVKWHAHLNSNIPIYLAMVLVQASNKKAMEEGKDDLGVRVGVEIVDYHSKML